MARIRSVKPDICQHEVVAELSDAAERTLIRLWTHADDDGRGVDNVKLIKAAIYPLNDEKTEEEIDELLDELEDAGFLRRYEVGGRSYFEVPNFSDHQKPRHPVASKCPPPPPDYTPPADRRRVTASTPQSLSAVRDHVSPQTYGVPPAGGEGLGVGVGEGGIRPERVPTIHDLLVPSASPSMLEEVDVVLGELVDCYGLEPVDQAVQALLDDRRRFSFPSKVRVALTNLLGPAVVEAKPGPLDLSAAADRVNQQAGVEYTRRIESLPVDPNAASTMRSIRQSLRHPEPTAEVGESGAA